MRRQGYVHLDGMEGVNRHFPCRSFWLSITHHDMDVHANSMHLKRDLDTLLPYPATGITLAAEANETVAAGATDTGAKIAGTMTVAGTAANTVVQRSSWARHPW